MLKPLISRKSRSNATLFIIDTPSFFTLNVFCFVNYCTRLLSKLETVQDTTSRPLLMKTHWYLRFWVEPPASPL